MPEMPPADSTSVTPPANVPPLASLNSSPPLQQDTRPETFEKASTLPAPASKLNEGAGSPPLLAASSPVPARNTFALALIFKVDPVPLVCLGACITLPQPRLN